MSYKWKGTRTQTNLLEVRKLTKFVSLKGPSERWRILRRRKDAPIVFDVSFEVKKGESFGIVGLPGCGKSILAKIISKQVLPTAGSVLLEGRDIFYEVEDVELQKSVKTIFSKESRKIDRSEVHSVSLLPARIVGLTGLDEPSSEDLKRVKSELAFALASNPKLIIVGEYLNTVDSEDFLKIQGILAEAKEDFDLTYLFIQENLEIVNAVCDRFAVMFRAQIIEKNVSSKPDLKPLHPFTQMLYNYNTTGKFEIETALIHGISRLKPFERVRGCDFFHLCRHWMDICKNEKPRLYEEGDDVYVACHMFGYPREKAG